MIIVEAAAQRGTQAVRYGAFRERHHGQEKTILTRGQINHFYTFGFLFLPQLLSKDEIAIMKRESTEVFDEARNERPFDGKQRQAVQPFFEWKPFLSSLVEDDRIYGIGESLLGPDFFLIGTEGNLHVGDTQWHGAGLDDDYGGSPHQLQAVKIGFYLDPLNKETGCLRVIPGSHHRPFSEQLQVLNAQQSEMPFGVSDAEMPSVALECQPGDVIVFQESLFHGAFGGGTGRHQHAISFFAAPVTEEQEAWLRRLYERWEYALHPAKTFVNSDRPRIRRLVSRLVDMGFETFERP